jgi:hypothetical protein
MAVTNQDRQVVQNMCQAMQAGESGFDTLVGLFTDDAVFIEPFTGQPQSHTGIEAIRARALEMVQQPRPPDFELKIDQVTMENGELTSYWTCTSAMMPVPMKGRDELKIRDGKISYLKINIIAMPGAPV